MIVGPCPHCEARNITRVPPDLKFVQRRCEGCARVYWLAVDQEFPCALLPDHVTRNRRGNPVLTVDGQAAFQAVGDHWHERDADSGEWEWRYKSPMARI